MSTQQPETGQQQGQSSSQQEQQGQQPSSNALSAEQIEALKALGIEDPDNYKASLGKANKEAEQSRKTAKQLQQQIADLQRKADEANQGKRSETEQLQAQLQQLADQFQKAERERARLEAASDFKITKDYLPLLTATDPEELRAQAELVSTLLAKITDLEKAGSAGNGSRNGSGSTLPGQGQGGAGTSDLDTQIAQAEAKGDRQLAGQLKLQKLQKLVGAAQ